MSVFLPILLILCLTAPAAFGEDRPAVRVTTGVVEIDGWQNGLVKRNPNLSRWHWNPLYVYKQGIVGGRQKGVPVPGNQPTSKYQSNKPAEDSHYIKPMHVPFNPKALAEVEARGAVSGALSEKRTNEAVSGKIQPPRLPKEKQAQTAPAPFQNVWFKQPAYSVYDSDKAAARSVAEVYGQVKEKPAPPKAKELKAQPKRLSNAGKN
ncbi:MAG: hypothetical protein C5B53_07950 [Candidatus Melainabacteria bacterium]|nr:MAG: hypothetical protein C5B53_07950 [Candidatus Melainabacteria bacterium]